MQNVDGRRPAWDYEKAFQSWNRRLWEAARDVADKHEMRRGRIQVLRRLANDSRLTSDLRRESRRMARDLEEHDQQRCPRYKYNTILACTYCMSDATNAEVLAAVKKREG